MTSSSKVNAFARSLCLEDIIMLLLTASNISRFNSHGPVAGGTVAGAMSRPHKEQNNVIAALGSCRIEDSFRGSVSLRQDRRTRGGRRAFSGLGSVVTESAGNWMMMG